MQGGTPKAQPDTRRTPQPAPKAIPKAEKTFSDYVDNVRVRTGAYTITGIDRTVTLKSGQTLQGLSRTYLGPGMECYIEAVNGGRTDFKAGEKIRIPTLKRFLCSLRILYYLCKDIVGNYIQSLEKKKQSI